MRQPVLTSVAMSPSSPTTPRIDERFVVTPARFRRFAAAALVTFVVITVVGAAVRLTGSGLGCADWPNCSNSFIEFGTPNQAMEQANRLLSGLGALIAAGLVTIGARRRRPYRRDLFGLSLALVAGVVANIPLGGITVLLDLHPAAVGSHFVLGMTMIAVATVLLWRSSHEFISDRGSARDLQGQSSATPSPAGSLDGPIVWLSRTMLVTLAALMLTGPLVTGSGPHAGDAAARRFGFAVPDVTRIHSLNMWLFLACAVTILVLVARMTGQRDPAPQTNSDLFRLGYALLGAIAIQGAIGYAQYELGIPAWLVILHVTGSAVVVITAVRFHLGLSDHVGGRVPAGGPPDDILGTPSTDTPDIDLDTEDSDRVRVP